MHIDLWFSTNAFSQCIMCPNLMVTTINLENKISLFFVKQKTGVSGFSFPAQEKTTESTLVVVVSNQEYYMLPRSEVCLRENLHGLYSYAHFLIHCNPTSTHRGLICAASAHTVWSNGLLQVSIGNQEVEKTESWEGRGVGECLVRFIKNNIWKALPKLIRKNMSAVN